MRRKNEKVEVTSRTISFLPLLEEDFDFDDDASGLLLEAPDTEEAAPLSCFTDKRVQGNRQQRYSSSTVVVSGKPPHSEGKRIMGNGILDAAQL